MLVPKKAVNSKTVQNRMEVESFKCKVCGNVYPTAVRLGVHKWKEHNIRGRGRKKKSKSYTCPVCARVINGPSKFVLTMHLRSHQPAALPFKCDPCGVEFKKAATLKAHQEQVHQGIRTRLKCDLCPNPKEFASAHTLERHVVAVHVVDKEFQCSICNKSFITEAELNKHMRFKHERRWGCDKCPRAFLEKQGLIMHLQRSHVRNEFCSTCRKSFPTTEDYRQHIKVDADTEPVGCPDPACELVFETTCLVNQHWSATHNKPAVESSSAQTEDRIQEANTPFDCDFCDKSFTTDWHRRSHKRHVHPDSQWECEPCQRTFKHRWDYARHKRDTHSAEPQYKCEVCLKLYRTKSHLKFHLRTHETGNPYRCSKCPKSYSTPWLLRYHLTTSHEEVEKPYKCPHCPMRFSFKANLEKRHIPSHSDVKHFTCDGCSKQFKSRSSLHKHGRQSCTANKSKCTAESEENIINKQTRGKSSSKFKCEICSKLLASASGLNWHIKSHDTDKPYKCSKCPKSYIARKYLKIHLASSHGEGDLAFKCPHCPQRCVDRYTLEKRHIPTHFDARPISCDGCPSTFKTTDRLQKHKASGKCPSNPLTKTTKSKDRIPDES